MRRLRISREDSWIVSYVMITATSFITCFTLQMICTGIPIYCVDIGKSTAEAGIFAGFYSVAVIATGLFAGRMVDTRGKWNMACLGLGLLCLSIIGKAFLPIFSLFVLYQVVQGIGFSISSTAQSAMVLDTLSNNRIVRGIGYYSVIKSLSYSLGSSAAVALSERFGTDRFFLYTLFIVLVAVILNVMLEMPFFKRRFPVIIEKSDTKVITAKDLPQYHGIDKFIEVKALPICLIQFIFTFSLTLTTSYLASYTKSIGLMGISIYFTTNAMTMLAVRMFFSKKIEKLGNLKTCVIGLILACLSTVGILFARSAFAFALLAIPNAIGISFVNPTINALSTSNVPSSRRGVASSTYALALDIGSGVGGMLWGILIPSIGYRYAFLSSAILLLADLVLGYRIIYGTINKE